mgnify:CR=1 FL=1
MSDSQLWSTAAKVIEEGTRHYVPDFMATEALEVLTAAGWTIIPPETTDGWSWRLLDRHAGFDIDHNGRTIVSVFFTGSFELGQEHRPIPVFMSEAADVLTRHFASVSSS